MSKPKFKKGDRVRCVHELIGAGIDGDFILKEGQEVTVVNPMTEWGSTRVTDGTNEDGWDSDFFELIPTPTKPKFKKGDRVRVHYRTWEGDGIIEELHSRGRASIRMVDGRSPGSRGLFNKGEFGEIKPTPTKKHRWTVEEEVRLWDWWVYWSSEWSVYTFCDSPQLVDSPSRTPAAIRSKLYELIRIDKAQP
ncbi:MAG: hypothetical protein ACYS76_09665 [Planctomycetota bacterium]|jgi:hypothetical protein